jgi:hypothetical protein
LPQAFGVANKSIMRWANYGRGKNQIWPFQRRANFFYRRQTNYQKKMQELEFNRIKLLVKAAKQGSHSAAYELLFQTKGYFKLNNPTKENKKIIKILQHYISECLDNCLEKPLSSPNATNELFSNMDDKNRATLFYKAFHLNRPGSEKRDKVMRNYGIAEDYCSLIKAPKNLYNKKGSVVTCLCCKWGIEERQCKNIVNNKSLIQYAENEINIRGKKYAGKQYTLYCLDRKTIEEIATTNCAVENVLLGKNYDEKKHGRLNTQSVEKIKIFCIETYTNLSSEKPNWKQIFTDAFNVSSTIVSQHKKEHAEIYKHAIRLALDIAQQAALIQFFNLV